MALARLRKSDLVANERADLFEIIRQRSFRRHASGVFRLASGLESKLYFNMKATIMHPQGGLLVARAMLEFARDEGADLVGGLALGAVPTLGAIAAVSAMENRPMRTFFVRQEAKEHGTRELIEGLAPEESFIGKRVVVVDDVATKGGSIMQAIQAARDLGAIVDRALVIVDREKGAEAFLHDRSVRLSSLFYESDFSEA